MPTIYYGIYPPRTPIHSFTPNLTQGLPLNVLAIYTVKVFPLVDRTTNTMSQERITPTDRDALAFVARFPGADTESVAQALVANPSRFDNDGVTRSIHPTENVVSRRMAKLDRLGCIQSWRSPAAQITHYGIIEGGMDALKMFGQAPADKRGIAKKSGLALMHGRDIANIAAQFMYGEYVDPKVTALIGDNITVDSFVTDSSIHSAISALYQEAKELGQDFQLHEYAQAVFSTSTEDELEDPLFWHSQPELLALAAPEGTGTKYLTHRPDLVVLTESGKRVAIEVERNFKTLADYVDVMVLLEKTLTTYKDSQGELLAPIHNLVWLCATPQIKNALKKAANAVDPILIDSGFVVIADLTRADGTPLTYGEIVPAPSRRSTRPKAPATNTNRPPAEPTPSQPVTRPVAPTQATKAHTAPAGVTLRQPQG